MRKIKFRAWDRNRKEMIYIKNNIFLHIDTTGWYFTNNTNKNLEKITPTNSYNADLLQYTGLKDKNGIEIYEGDIITGYFKKNGGCKIKMMGFVEWDYSGYIIKIIKADDRNGLVNYFEFIESDYSKKLNDLENPSFLEIKIIGNIYENKELLNEK